MIAIFPEIAQAAAGRDLERLAILVRKYFGEDQKFAPRLDLERLARQAGLEVEILPLDAHAVLLAKDERGSFRIVCVVGDTLGAEARAFALAHQIGHFLLHVQPLIARGEWNVAGYRETICPLKRYTFGEEDLSLDDQDRAYEREADDFAAALLLPQAMVGRAAEKLQTGHDVAQFFGVSEACLRRRMQQIGLRSDEPVNFLDAARKIGIPVSDEAALKDDIDPRGALEAPPADKAIPRSFAASSYGRIGRETDKPLPAPSGAAPGPVAKSSSAPESPPGAGSLKARIIKGEPNPQAGRSTKTVLTGMDRIREIARKIDKNA